MRHKRLKLSTLFLLGLGLTNLQAQESVDATGGNASGNEGSVSYSVGQVVYQTHTGTNSSIAQGIQQPYEITDVTAIEAAKGPNLSISTYPNPTTEFLGLKVESEKLNDLSYQLFDMNGKLLQSGRITGRQTSIVMSNLVSATYFVKVIQCNKEVKIFKIIKH